MRIDIFTIFPDIFIPLEVSITGRARKSGLFSLLIHDIRDYAEGPHKNVDDRPYGGGPGMVMKPEPIVKAVEEVINTTKTSPEIVIMSPRGQKFTHRLAVSLSKKNHIAIICGRYEGIDERVMKYLGASEISIGDYVLCGGEVPAMAVTESIVRLLPGALGDEDSANEDSFAGGLLEYPQYTRPENFKGLKVPKVLLSGNHQEIKDWRKKQAVKNTLKNRPDLLCSS
jgi:tRNA (guanine37-N1)-methyltransferase